MADNTVLSVGTGGDTVRDKDRTGVKTQIVGLDLTIGGGSETLMNGAMPVTDNSGSLTVDNAGTFAVQDSQVLVDNAGFTDGTSKVFPVGYIFDDVAGTALTENDVGAPRINANRASVATIEDGATRARYATVTASNALKVDGSAVTQPVSGTVSITANSAVNVAQVNGTTTDTNSGNKSAGTQRVVLATDQPALTNALLVQSSPVTTGGLTIGAGSGAKLISASGTNATSVKASAGQLYGWYISNSAATSAFIKFYNTAGTPTAGSGTPVMTLMIPAGSAANAAPAADMGIAFGTGIGLTITGAAADADTTSVAANDVVVNLFFK